MNAVLPLSIEDRLNDIESRLDRLEDLSPQVYGSVPTGKVCLVKQEDLLTGFTERVDE
jgi:hypothetical protein